MDVKKIKYKINSDISRARTLASSYYTDKDVFRCSIEKIFSSSWQFALDADQLNDNNIIPINFLSGTLSVESHFTRGSLKSKHIF